ncbi:MAG TPA: Na+/H+ antiporter, partial [Alphaproteobacteria bacterium]
LTVAFALAAVLSPTDPVAVSAIAARVPIPQRIMHILEAESLLNDASGLVCLRFAIAATLMGTFSITGAMGTFAWLALGGIAIGIGATLGISLIKNWVSRNFGEETGTHILISLLIPFGAYLAAEHVHCSGILAAVAAGISMSYVEATGKTMGLTRMRRNVVWDTVQFAANGAIFVLLGQQLPVLAKNAVRVVNETGHNGLEWLGIYTIVIMTALGAMRYIWVWVSLKMMAWGARRKGQTPPPVHWRLVAAMSVAGVRGAITLAGILTLPLALSDGTPFPGRNVAIFLAAGVIILSLIVASIGLPRLMAGLDLPEPSHQADEDAARISAAKSAILAIEQAQHNMAEGGEDADIFADAGMRVMDYYCSRLDNEMKTGEDLVASRRIEKIERDLRLAGLRAEREEIFRLGRARAIEDDLMRKLVRELDLMEVRYTS